jgi:hypothetical protein
MNFPFAILIAQMDSRLEGFSSGFREHRARMDSGDLVLLLTAFVVVFTVLWLVARWSERRVRNDSSLELFWTLTKTHGIGWRDRWLLWRLARAKRLAEPALLFLDPRLTAPQSSHHLAPQATARLKALRRRLFSGIDRTGDELAGSSDSANGRCPNIAAAPVAEVESSSQEGPPMAATGGLEEALSALRALNLRDQFIPKEEPVSEAPPGEPDERPPTAEFPASDSPILDLYPWLGNEWEIADSDEAAQ